MGWAAGVARGSKKMNHRIFLSVFLTLAALPVFSAENRPLANPLEAMLSGFATCDLQGVYIDWQTNRAAHPYLNQLTKRGVRIQDGFARFKHVDQTFHGFRVLELRVPAQTWTAHRLILDAPHTRARATLERAWRIKLPASSAQADDAEEVVPNLFPYPGHSNWSILECDSPL